MVTAISIACIQQGKILVVNKKGVWILPGGKPHEWESDIDCLNREISEELPKSKFSVTSFFGHFKGETPHTHEPLMASVYLGKVDGDLTPAAEIGSAVFFSKKELERLPLSEVTRKIIDALMANRYL